MRETREAGPVSTSADPVLKVQALRFAYPGRLVFSGWSHEFEPGMTWVRGGNGSGKSTLLKLLAGALPFASGRLAVRGIDAAAQPLAYRREVFWCGPGAIPFDHLRPPEYFAFMRSLYPGFDDTSLASHVRAFGLNEFLSQRLQALSTGTQRKVWLAAALVAGTSAVLLDEPLNALDHASLQHLREALAGHSRSRRAAWIVASHESLGEAGQEAAVLMLGPGTG